ncbi:dioxygenase [Kordiimonas sp. SCSIO 12603]|uniref:DODA-type extradiol aromatic ring-opening family dioxygenase n=1 Tax=Kordiimonas sp. SCSIO 12603 TaxID=2829596 RepID=UPI002107C98D|nr:class III extradiol ring-cleavage dioxygenase [Kordiimonas sp. SCSIO 12603]UTW58876.1 dioxygenase [Kordiimonas sp. SCSIO 12603]
MTELEKMPILFVSHGGGPLPLMGDIRHADMVETMQALKKKLPKPKAILMFSAHWEEKQVQVTGAEKPELIYDYYGFPKEAYEILYPTTGAPFLAASTHQILCDAGIDTIVNSERGFDHGMFVPLKLLFPEAGIPVVQISMHRNLDPEFHINLGKRMAELRRKGVMIIGSGMTFHNMRALRQRGRTENINKNRAFHRWLDQALKAPNISEEERASALSGWADAPHARYCHPREEHLLPVHVCYGAAQQPVSEIMPFDIFGYETRCYLWS